MQGHQYHRHSNAPLLVWTAAHQSHTEQAALLISGGPCGDKHGGQAFLSQLTFHAARPPLLHLLVLLILLVLRGAGPGVQLLEDGGAEVLELTRPDPRLVAEVVGGKEGSGTEALEQTRGREP